MKRGWALALILLATLCATWQRAQAVQRLPVDHDELVYLPAAYDYAEMLKAGHWRDVSAYRGNFEHPPLVKLLFASALWASGAPEPEWSSLQARGPVPEPAWPAFRVTRWLSAAAGILQVALTAAVSPLGALLLAFDPYHAAYTAEAYLEAVPGFFALLAVQAFERARAAGEPLRQGWLAATGSLLGLAAAGKYPYGLVVGLTLLPFLLHARAPVRAWAALAMPTVAVFLLADPALWPAPLSALWESVTFHWAYSNHGEDVQKLQLPWFQPLMYLIHPGPARWHAGVFATGLNAWVLLPLALAGARATARARPVWAVWAGVGFVFLLLWPTKWPQYQLLLLPALCVCAAEGARTLVKAGARRLQASRSARASPGH
ncbi:phospholipid carrier-dependent glycosyltransferase [Corallococcus sp. AS-1-12]|uniref:phospholipid carrier-dependent glycosyltransferase n=1 Tax=Corallococcus sp. AS-1-12 TaxID=2874598 RepID=UPI001CC0772D|nr:phospholipid carrier-dependent glycosyltransferase [Corallococcus sp. AS-1-12]MBZ4333420.1 hypothetical protein [Corallococcus sp. AS-1-12]